MIARSMLDRAVQRALRETLLPIVETPEFQARLASELARQVLERHRQEPPPRPAVVTEPPMAPLHRPSLPAPTARRSKLSEEERRQVRAMVESGVSFRDAAERFQIAKSALHRYARLQGWAVPGNGQPAETPAAAGVTVDPNVPAPRAQPVPADMPAADDPTYLADLAEARELIRQGKNAPYIAEFFGWELEHCQELCASERGKA